jgi:hypothetical protein
MERTYQRGDRVASRGDVTGRAYLAQADRKVEHEQAKRNTINALSERTVLVQIPGGRSFLLPKEAFDQVVTEAEEREAARYGH